MESKSHIEVLKKLLQDSQEAVASGKRTLAHLQSVNSNPSGKAQETSTKKESQQSSKNSH
jgi:hypothetical protein